MVIDSRRSDSQAYSFSGSAEKNDQTGYNSKYGQVVHAPKAGGKKKLQLFEDNESDEEEGESPKSEGTPVEIIGSGHFFNKNIESASPERTPVENSKQPDAEAFVV